jgi:hypothetical protein
MGRDPGLEAIQARQCLGLPLTGRLTVAQVKRVTNFWLFNIIRTRGATLKR